MTTATVVILVLLWGGVLLPGLLRDRRSSPISTVDGFHEAMTRLARCDSRTVMVQSGSGRMQVYPRRSTRSLLLARRRQLLGRLATVAAATTVTALLLGGAWWLLATLTILALGMYAAVLRSLVVARAQAAQVVPLRPAATPARPVEVDRHTPTSSELSPTAEPLFAGVPS